MNYYEVLKINWDELVLYLRKSRQDDPGQSIEEVLEKHEEQLQAYAEREHGGRIPEENIYREVVSGGESILEREAMRKVLARIEDPKIKGVLVMEPQRLSRGSLTDCDKLMTTFELTSTLVVTPMMTYDLSKKMERKFFQDELLRGRDYLDYTKEILFRGRVAAAKRGCYNARVAPYGYRKITIGKDNTLEIVEDQAEVVRLVFDIYVKEQRTPYQIACRLNDMGIEAPMGGIWKKDTIRHMIRNAHYNGKVVFNKIKRTPVLENGEVKHKKLTQPDDEVIIAEGKHPAIIDNETWQAAQALVARNPRVKHEHELRNPLSEILVCGKCGMSLRLHPYKCAQDRYTCKLRPPCFKSAPAYAVMEAVIAALEESELPALQLKVKNNDGDALKIQQNKLKKLEKQMEEYKEQEETQYELLEQKKYTQELFDRRNAALREKMEICQAQIYKTKASLPQSVDYAERVEALQKAIDILKDPAATATEQHKVVKAIVDKIIFTSVPSDRENRKRLVKGAVSPFNLEVILKL